MSETFATLSVERLPHEPVPVRVRASGRWTFAGLKGRERAIARALTELRGTPAERVAWDLRGVLELDDAGAVWLAQALAGAARVEVAPRHAEMLRQVSEGMLVPAAPQRFDPLRPLEALGRGVWAFFAHLRDAVALLGTLVVDAAALARRPRDIPWRAVLGRRLPRRRHRAAGDDARRIPRRRRAHLPFGAASCGASAPICS
ncbi:MAG: hypothetical protein RML56_04640 [Burkholderiales bacterium]|nr:hypothetical protein [Burkholderiales bacterium]